MCKAFSPDNTGFAFYVHIAHIAFVVLTSFWAAFYAADVKAAEGGIEVNADNAQYGPEGDSAVFTGNVIVKAQGWTLSADSLTVSTNADDTRSYEAIGSPLRLNGESEGQAIVANAEMLMSNNDNATVLMRNKVVFCVQDSCQGGKMSANEVIWLRDKNRVIATGNPIKFERPGEGEKMPPMQGTAQRIEYDIAGGEIKLSGAATFRHGEGEINGEIIVYNVKTGAFRADATEGGRVRATFGEE